MGRRNSSRRVPDEIDFDPLLLAAFPKLLKGELVTDERRRYRRASRLLEIRWEDLSGKYNARITDISPDGCYIESIGKVTVGQQIRFETQLPTAGWMPFRGEVVNHHPNLGFGVRFIGLTEQDKRALAQIL